MKKLPLIKDYMDKHVYTVRPDTGILEAVDFLIHHRVTGAPVVDKEQCFVGMLTEKECMRLLAKGVDANIPQGTVAEFMVTEVKTIPPDMDVYYAAGLLLHESQRRLPVVRDGILVGAITRFDILRVIQANLCTVRPRANLSTPQGQAIRA